MSRAYRVYASGHVLDLGAAAAFQVSTWHNSPIGPSVSAPIPFFAKELSGPCKLVLAESRIEAVENYLTENNLK